MTDVNDLYEVNDREPEPCDWFPADEPVDLVKLRKDVEASLLESRITGPHLSAVFAAVMPMAAELEEARRRIAAFEALPTREEWVVTGGPDFPTEPGGPPVWPDAGVIAYVARHATAQLWRRLLLVRPYEPVDERGPF